MGLVPQYIRPHVPGRRIDDVDQELRGQDESAARAQRNLLIAIVFCIVLAVLAGVRDLGAGVALFAFTAIALAIAFGVITFVRRSIRRNFG